MTRSFRSKRIPDIEAPDVREKAGEMGAPGVTDLSSCLFVEPKVMTKNAIEFFARTEAVLSSCAGEIVRLMLERHSYGRFPAQHAQTFRLGIVTGFLWIARIKTRPSTHS